MSDQLAESPDTSAPDSRPTNTPKYKRITREQRAIMRDLAKLNTSQVEIARVLGVSQPTVSNWLAELSDTTVDASEYLRAKALRMAENIVKNGRAADHVAVLKGVNVLQDDSTRGGITVVIGGNANVQINAVAPGDQT